MQAVCYYNYTEKLEFGVCSFNQGLPVKSADMI